MDDLTSLPLIDAPTITELLPYGALIDALEDGHRRPAAVAERVVFGPDGSDQSFLGLVAWQPGDAIGVKLVTVFPGNVAAGRPSVQAVVGLFDGTTGAPLALLDGTELTYRKTAADSALGARHLARPDAMTLLMVGAGALAAHLVAAHRCVRPSIARVLVWNRTRSRADALATELSAGGVDATVVDDLAAAVATADIVSTATMTKEPLVAGDVVADLYELCRGDAPGRRPDDTDTITLFENGGGGHLDLMAAAFAWRRYEARSR